MKTVSNEFRQKMYDGAKFYQEAKILFADGRERELSKQDFYISGNTYSDGPGTNAFPLGEAMAKHITMSLVNDDDRFSDYDFYMAKITVWLKCDLSETTESILLGTYTVTTPETYGASVTVEAVDDMYKGDKEYTTELIFPATIGTILRDSCMKIGVSLLSTTFSNDSFEIQEKPEDITHRQLWGMIAMLAGGNARMDENNYLEIVEYDFSYFEKEGLDGGCFDTNIPYASGDAADGGDFMDWGSGDSVDGGDFAELGDFHFFYRIKTPTIATDDVVITGVQTTVDDMLHLFGTEGYVIKVENQLVNEEPGTAMELIGSKIVGLKFRPFTIDHTAYPLAEFGDICYVADRKGNVYQSVITDVNFTFFGYTTISCAADDPLRNSSKYHSSSTEAVMQARKNTKKQLSAYDLAVQQLTNLITNSFGVFKSEEKRADGSMIYYLHDKTELASSMKIWKMTADAFAVSSDGGKTWNAGLDSEGNAVVNVLSAIGVNANWITAGLISDASGKNSWDLDNGKMVMENAVIKINGSVRKHASDYTEEDLSIANEYTIGLREITQEALEKYDIDGDGEITVLDVLKINKMLIGEVEYYDIDTSIEINPLSSQQMLKTLGVSVGANGLFSNTISAQKVKFDKCEVYSPYYNGYARGETGELYAAGKHIRFDNGILTRFFGSNSSMYTEFGDWKYCQLDGDGVYEVLYKKQLSISEYWSGDFYSTNVQISWPFTVFEILNCSVTIQSEHSGSFFNAHLCVSDGSAFTVAICTDNVDELNPILYFKAIIKAA